MISPAIPDDEALRLAALHQLLLLDTPPEERFDRITEFARFEFDVPIALITLVDEDRQWFKSSAGLNVCETSRDVSFCGHAVLQTGIMVVEDALLDDRFHDNPLVTDEPHIRFYAGAPLTVNGYNIGTLCLIDTKPKQLDQLGLSIFSTLRSMVVQELVQQQAEVIER